MPLFFPDRTALSPAVADTALSGEFTYRNGLLPKVQVTSPPGQSEVVLLRQVAPGHYQASLPVIATDANAYHFALLQGGGINASEAAGAGERTLFYTWTDEYRPLPPNNAVLREISERTGGMFAAKAQDIFADYDDSQLVPRPLWYWFVAAALLLCIVRP